MLPKEERLIAKKDFLKVQRAGQSFFVDFLQLQFVKNNQNKTRIGLVVGTKFSKKATERNALKRKLRAIFAQESRNMKENVDVVVSAKNNPNAKKTFAQLKDIVDKLLEKANYCKKPTKRR